MSFQEWLPITRRNRVALGLAGNHGIALDER